MFSAGFAVSPGFAWWRYAGFWSFWLLAVVQQAQAAIVLVVLRRLGGAVLFRSSCPSPNSSYPFWLLALTFRSSRPAFCGRLTSPVSHMDIFDLLTQPTTLIGCLLGFALAVVLHFLFPENNLTFLQAIIVAASTLIGMLIEYSPSRKKRNQK